MYWLIVPPTLLILEEIYEESSVNKYLDVSIYFGALGQTYVTASNTQITLLTIVQI